MYNLAESLKAQSKWFSRLFRFTSIIQISVEENRNYLSQTEDRFVLQ